MLLFLCVSECSRYLVSRGADDNPAVISEADMFPSTNVTAVPTTSSYAIYNTSDIAHVVQSPNITARMYVPPSVHLVTDLYLAVPYNSTRQNLPHSLSLQPEDQYDHARTFNKCVRVQEMGRFARSSHAFVLQYQLRIGTVPFPNRIGVDEHEPIVLKFKVKPVLDTGGTLQFQINILKDKVVSINHIYIYNPIHEHNACYLTI